MTRLHPDDIRALADAIGQAVAGALRARDAVATASPPVTPAPAPVTPAPAPARRVGGTGEWFTSKEFAAELGLSHTTVRTWRASGDGPRWYRFGKWVRYARADIDAWLATRATSEIPRAHELAARTRVRREGR